MNGSSFFLRRMVGGSVLAMIIFAAQLPALAQIILSPAQGRLWQAWSKDESQWTALRKSTDFYGNVSARKKVAAQAIVVLRNLLGDLHRLQKVPAFARFKATFDMHEILATATLALLGDKSSLEKIAKGVKSAVPANRARALVEQSALQWWQASQNLPKQYAVINGLWRFDPKLMSHQLILALSVVARRGSATPELQRDLQSTALWVAMPPATPGRADNLQSCRITDREAGHPFHLYGATLNGGVFSTFINKGKPAVIDFWATWCPWCVKGLPELAAIYAKYHPKGLEMVSVSQDANLLTVRRFLAQHPQMKWPQLYRKTGFYVAHGRSLPIATSFLPTTVIVNRRGIIVDIITGYAKGAVAADVKYLFRKK